MGQIKVKARFKKSGFAFFEGLMRRNGEVFYISDEKDKDGKVIAFSDNWMVKVDEKTPTTPVPKKGQPLPEIYQANPEAKPHSGKGSGHDRGVL